MLLNGKVLIAGGDMGDGEGVGTGPNCTILLRERCRYGRMTVGREEDATVLLSDGAVLFAGGHGGVNGDNDSSAEIYNPATGAFSPTGSVLTSRDWLKRHSAQ
jgi:hypothetical protein